MTNQSHNQDAARRLRMILTDLTRKARFEGWERGKEQTETPTAYTLHNEDYPEKIAKEAEAALNTLLKEARKDELEKISGVISGGGSSLTYRVNRLQELNKETS